MILGSTGSGASNNPGFRARPLIVPRTPGRLLAGPVGDDPEPPIPLGRHDATGTELLDVTVAGIGARRARG